MATEATTQYVVWVVQRWIERYQYWADCAQPSENMFTPAKVGHEHREDAVQDLVSKREGFPAETYRLVRVTMTTDVIA